MTIAGRAQRLPLPRPLLAGSPAVSSRALSLQGLATLESRGARLAACAIATQPKLSSTSLRRRWLIRLRAEWRAREGAAGGLGDHPRRQ